jgi:indole-3-glycerol phosphate synthase
MILDEIVASKRAEIVALAPGPPRRARGERVFALARPVGEALRFVTEIKFKSPSAGPLSRALSAGERAVAYARAGASMISVLCDGPFFDGGFHHLAEARAALDAVGLATPLLAKEFVLDERQIREAASRGADAVLLIARIVSPEALAQLVASARATGLEPLVEIVSEAELAFALAADAKVIGVNARDLDTLVMDHDRARRVLAAIPDTCIAVHLSGLRGPEDVVPIARTDVDAALVGEALMRQADPMPLLRAMVESSALPGHPE